MLCLQIYYQSGFDTAIKSIDTPDNITSFTITGLMPSTNYTVYFLPLLEQEKGILVLLSQP